MTTLMIIVRGLGANWLGAYGNEWVASPNLDRLAAEGVVYDQHFATDLAVPTFGGTVIRVKHLKDAIAKVKDGANAVIVCDELLPPWTINVEVFESYCEDADEPLTPWPDPPPGEFKRDDDEAWDRLHLSFAAAVTLFDAAVGKLLVTIDLETTTVLVTSDAGFPLGEHGIVGSDGSHLHEELVHLPLIVRRPKAERAGDRIAMLTTPADVAAILKSDMPTRNRVISIWNDCSAVKTSDWTLLKCGDKVRLHRRPGDKWCVNDIAMQFPEVVEDLANDL